MLWRCSGQLQSHKGVPVKLTYIQYNHDYKDSQIQAGGISIWILPHDDLDSMNQPVSSDSSLNF